jgi:hypothetical protein
MSSCIDLISLYISHIPLLLAERQANPALEAYEIENESFLDP